MDVPAVLSTRTRLLGSGKAQKNDPNDARSVAIAALRTDGLARVRVDEHAQVLKLLAKRHRDLGRLRGKAACRIHALLMELELIEPSLYLRTDERAPGRFATAFDDYARRRRSEREGGMV